MNNRPPDEPNGEVLAEPVAERLLARASELDAARAAGATVTELRAAAAEAGISARAFDAALAEIQEQGRVPDLSGQRRRRRIRPFAIAAAILITVGALAVGRMVAPVRTTATAPMVEEIFQLRCLSPGEAGELVRPLLRLQPNTIVASPRALTIRATPAQIQSVRAVLDQYERAGAPACAAAPAPK